MSAWHFSARQLEKIKEQIEVMDLKNPNVEIYPNFYRGVLLGISIRFCAPMGYMTKKKERYIYQKIEKLSKNRLVPERNGLLKNGILELRFNSMQRYRDEWVVIDPLQWIGEEMIDYIYDGKGVPIITA